MSKNMRLWHRLRNAPESAANRSLRPKWHYLYYVLAGFDVFTVCVGLYLSYQIMGIYIRSVEDNQTWAERVEAYSRLGELAAAVNAPGNDIFDSRDVDAESQRMHTAIQAFDKQFANLRQELQTNVTPAEAAPLLARLDWVSAAMDMMTGEARLIFSYFRTRQPDEAGKRMATMDRTYATVNTALAGLRHAVAGVQQKHFEQQTVAAANLEKYEYGIGALVLLMVGGATFYGRRIAKQVQSDAAGKERQLHEMNEAQARITERTLELERSNVLLRTETTQRLRAQNALHDTNQRLQALLKHTLEAQEAQRHHIARELHEELAQTVVALNLHLASLRSAAETRNLEPTLKGVGTIVDSTLHRLRALAGDLAPHGMEHIGLGGTLVSQLDKWTEDTGIAAHFSEHLAERRLAQDVEVAVYRFVEDAVANVITHAYANNLWVELVQVDRELHVHVRDDGVGFDVESVRRGRVADKNLGITLMEQRAALLGGRLEINSGPERGTEVHAVFPTAGPAAAQLAARQDRT